MVTKDEILGKEPSVAKGFCLPTKKCSRCLGEGSIGYEDEYGNTTYRLCELCGGSGRIVHKRRQDLA